MKAGVSTKRQAPFQFVIDELLPILSVDQRVGRVTRRAWNRAEGSHA